jgi:tripartite-type tricarboxylate transporter receptor subunit TctC
MTRMLPFRSSSMPTGIIMKKSFRLALCFFGFLTAWGAHAQTTPSTYPDRPVRMVVPLTPGSGADIAGRIVAKYLTELWKQPVVIENRPGAGGLIGTGAVVASRPTATPCWFNPHRMRPIPPSTKNCPTTRSKA